MGAVSSSGPCGPNLQPAGLAQLVERWSHNPKVVSSILTPGNFAWMNSEGSGLGLQIQGGLTSQWFESTFCAFAYKLFWLCRYGQPQDTNQQKTNAAPGEHRCSMRGSNPRPLAHKTNTLPTELMEHVCRSWLPASLKVVVSRVRGLVVMIVACQVMDPGSIPGERNFFVHLPCPAPGRV
jgi:hypothetical protein